MPVPPDQRHAVKTTRGPHDHDTWPHGQGRLAHTSGQAVADPTRHWFRQTCSFAAARWGSFWRGRSCGFSWVLNRYSLRLRPCRVAPGGMTFFADGRASSHALTSSSRHARTLRLNMTPGGKFS